DAPRVANELPAGSAWNGKTDLPMDQTTFERVLSSVDHADTAADATKRASDASPHAASAAPSTASRAAPSTTRAGT
ncbi:MAG: hypothetical protein ACRET2_07470, partial [Steroidobacteraceae bacterium]